MLTYEFERVSMSENVMDLIFVHGMYLNGSSWQPWLEKARALGFLATAPSWPFHEGEPQALRRNVDPSLGKLRFREVVDYYKRLIDSLPMRPNLIGHSIGGLVVQKLLNEGYAKAGVAISSAPPQGIISFSPHFLRANFPHANPLAGNKPVFMTPQRLHYTFCNTMGRESSNWAFDKYVVPESRNVPRSTLTKQGKINFRAQHAPLLLIAGDADHLTPLSMIKKNAKAYEDSAGILEFKIFKGRSHFICNQDGWEEVADFALDWLKAN